MLTRFLISFEVALLQSAVVAFLLGMMAGEGLPFAVFTFIVGLVAADLIAGWNKVLLKIRNGGSLWGFFFAIADENRNSIKDIQYGRDLLVRKKEEAE